MISSTTKIFTIIGKPIEQALSPIVFNAMFSSLGMDAVFLANCVESENLQAAVAGLKALKISGFVVTMPYKRAVMTYLDEIDAKAQAIGSVNTVVRLKDGRYKGYTTDGDGFVQNLLGQGVSLQNIHVFMFGAGGGGRSIALSLLQAGVKDLSVCNIDKQEALETIEMVRSFTGYTSTFVPFKRSAVAKVSSTAQIIINTTCLGMKGKGSAHVDLLDWDMIDQTVVFADIVHTPFNTELLQRAESRGHKSICGNGMLIHQAVIAFELLTEKKGSAAIMEDELKIWVGHEEM